MLLRDDPDNVPAPSQLRDIPIGDRGCRTGGILREPQQGDSQQACEAHQRGNRPRSAAPQTGASLSMLTMVRHGALLALTQQLACTFTGRLRADFRRGLRSLDGLGPAVGRAAATCFRTICPKRNNHPSASPSKTTVATLPHRTNSILIRSGTGTFFSTSISNMRPTTAFATPTTPLSMP